MTWSVANKTLVLMLPRHTPAINRKTASVQILLFCTRANFFQLIVLTKKISQPVPFYSSLQGIWLGQLIIDFPHIVLCLIVSLKTVLISKCPDFLCRYGTSFRSVISRMYTSLPIGRRWPTGVGTSLSPRSRRWRSATKSWWVSSTN